MWQQYLCHGWKYIIDFGHILYLFDDVQQGLNSSYQKLQAIYLRNNYGQRIGFLDQLCHQFLAGTWSYEVHLLKSDSPFFNKTFRSWFCRVCIF